MKKYKCFKCGKEYPETKVGLGTKLIDGKRELVAICKGCDKYA